MIKLSLIIVIQRKGYSESEAVSALDVSSACVETLWK
jgi:hypothetical protein